MKKRLIITWMPSVIFEKTARSERESFRCNSFEAANRIMAKRNLRNILYASFGGRKASYETIKGIKYCRLF